MLSLISNIGATQEELKLLQREFIRLDTDRSGTLTKSELQQMRPGEYVDWDEVLIACDLNGDGVIDF